MRYSDQFIKVNMGVNYKSMFWIMFASQQMSTCKQRTGSSAVAQNDSVF